jgi:N-methylhydantoinase B
VSINRPIELGAALPLPKTGLKVGLGQVLMASSQGGGGFGDPLDRDPESVRTDVVDHLVSRVGALRDFGVVLTDAGMDDDLDDVTVDAAATHALRLARRRERLGGAAPLERDWTRIGRRLSTHFESVRQDSEEEVLCAHCGKRISGVGESIHAGLILCEKGVGARFSLSERYEGSERFRIRHFYCPGCATQVDVQVAMTDEPILETIASLSVPHANE